MTILNVIQKSTAFLQARAVDSPRLQSELLLAHVLKLPRLELYLKHDNLVGEKDLEAVRELVKRRGRREPLQHLVGTVDFCDFTLEVNQHALIPRPETEILAERAWQLLRQLPLERPRLLDFGTGTGCLAIGAALNCASAVVVAVDSSSEALELARRNAIKNRVDERVQFLLSDGFSALPSHEHFDLIVSNPPYIPSDEVMRLEPEIRDFEPCSALDGGPDGLRFFRLLASQAATFLRSSGRIQVEFGDGQAPAVAAIFKSENWFVESIVCDYSKKERFLVAVRG